MMFENDVDDERARATNGGGFENDLDAAPSIRARLHDHLPVLLLGIGVFALALGLHGAGAIVAGAAGAHLLIGLVLFVAAKMRSRVSR